jgi:branched-chain amino acid aminotransferase
MSVSRWHGGDFEEPGLEPVGPLELHPAAHVLHYASSIFEGLKAHRGTDGSIRIFRLDRHVLRMQQSAELLCLPVPDAGLLTRMILETVSAARDDIPDPPGSLYLRPTMIGTEANIGAAAAPSAEGILFVLASPVGDYFRATRPLWWWRRSGLDRHPPLAVPRPAPTTQRPCG